MMIYERMNTMLKGSHNAVFTIEGVDGSHKIDFDFGLFKNSSEKYNHELCRLACELVTVGYDKIEEDESAEAETGFPWTQRGLKATLDAMGFEHMEIQPKAERDEESYYIASRDIDLDGEVFNLIIAAFIGSYKKTWYSNFDPYGVDRVANGGKGYAGDAEKGIVHLGFADARDFMHERISAFIKKYADEKPIKILLMGHSRGAATANLLAAKLIDNGGFGNGIDIDADNVYTYCFATPNLADVNKLPLDAPGYKRIYSIVNPEDFVTEVLPKACGFGKYGTVYSLMGSDNRSIKDYRAEKDAMQKYYEIIKKDKIYMSYKDGNLSVQNIAKVMAGSMPSLDDFYNVKYKECGNAYSSYEYYKYTLCGYVSGNDTPEDQKNIDRAMKLMLGSAVDIFRTSPAFRKISQFFVFKEGLGGATGNKIGATYFSDSHRCETYLAYLLAMSEEQLLENSRK